jgi:hypothetical protein
MESSQGKLSCHLAEHIGACQSLDGGIMLYVKQSRKSRYKMLQENRFRWAMEWRCGFLSSNQSHGCRIHLL